MQHGRQMFIFEEETEPTESDDTEQVLTLELITTTTESSELIDYGPTCNNKLYYGDDSCTFECPVDGWKLELDDAGCCCFYFKTDSQDDFELSYSEF